MNTIITLTTIQLVTVSLGAASAFIIDLFFMASLSHSKLRTHEVKIVNRLNLLSIVSAIMTIAIQAIVLFIIPNTIPEQFLSMTFTTILFTIAAFVCGITLRRIHIPELIRYQNQHAHLSDHHIHHGEEIVLVSTISTASWLSAIIVYAVAQMGAYTSSIPFIIGYIVFVFVLSILTRLIKRHLLDSRKHKKSK